MPFCPKCEKRLPPDVMTMGTEGKDICVFCKEGKDQVMLMDENNIMTMINKNEVFNDYMALLERLKGSNKLKEALTNKIIEDAVKEDRAKGLIP